MTDLNRLVDKWVENGSGIAALALTQHLEPVEQDAAHRVIHPPTYADIGYNIDTLADGTRVALIDSVGSQANRMEPLLESESESLDDWLVPQVRVRLRSDGERVLRRSLLQMAHRAADAVVRSTKGFGDKVDRAFRALSESGDAWPLAVIAPTSLVFGVWDSRGTTSEKRPRLVRAIIRAWDVDELHAAAQFNSVWKELSSQQQSELAKSKKQDLSAVGFADAPAVFRKTKVKQWFEHGANPAARVLGGVLVRGPIVRDVTINLTALRGLRAGDEEKTRQLRRYLLALALYAATGEQELFLREGCHLRYAEEGDRWVEVPRRGERRPISLQFEQVARLAREAAAPFRRAWDGAFEGCFEFDFDMKAAKALLKKTKSGDEG